MREGTLCTKRDSRKQCPTRHQDMLQGWQARTMQPQQRKSSDGLDSRMRAGTMRPLPTEPLPIPPLCLAGRLPEQQNATVNLDLTQSQPPPGGGAAADITAWPEFHNGVAAGASTCAGMRAHAPLTPSETPPPTVSLPH